MVHLVDEVVEGIFLIGKIRNFPSYRQGGAECKAERRRG